MSRSRDERVSVVIPAYNRAEDLRGAVESVRAQTHPVHEIIVVDDGSQDDTREVVQALPGVVKYIYQANQGVSRARNRGLTEAGGELVALLDTDDRWDSTKLEVQTRVMATYPEVGWSATDIRLVRVEEPSRIMGGMERAVPVFKEQRHKPPQWFRTRLERRVVEAEEWSVEAYVGDAFGLLLHGNFVFPSTVVFRRSLIDEVGLFDPAFPRAEETDYFLRLAAASPLAIIDRRLTTYRTGGEDTLTSPFYTVELTEFALRALEKAVSQRGSLSAYERRSAEAGRRALLLRQAYAYLSDLNSREARSSLERLEEEGLDPGLKGRTLSALSRLPSPLLRALRWAKGVLGTPADARIMRKHG